MKNKGYLYFTILFALLLSMNISAQTDSIFEQCSKYIIPPFVSDGQQYKAILNNDKPAEFRSTFYGGSTYRVITCSPLPKGSIIFSLYDNDRNLLYTNADYQNTPYWDFKFKSTVDCIIEARLDPEKATSGFAIILIGFKQ